MCGIVCFERACLLLVLACCTQKGPKGRGDALAFLRFSSLSATVQPSLFEPRVHCHASLIVDFEQAPCLLRPCNTYCTSAATVGPWSGSKISNQCCVPAAVGSASECRVPNDGCRSAGKQIPTPSPSPIAHYRIDSNQAHVLFNCKR